MKLYIKMIKPMLLVPTSSQDYTPKYIPVESEDKWYQEDECEILIKKYEHLETTFDHLAFEEKYKEFELLKEQEAVVPLVEQVAVPLTQTSCRVLKKYYCGTCKQEITGNNVYCHRCGRKVKWND